LDFTRKAAGIFADKANAAPLPALVADIVAQLYIPATHKNASIQMVNGACHYISIHKIFIC